MLRHSPQSTPSRLIPLRPLGGLLAVLCVTAIARGQGTRADYERAGNLPQRTANKIYRTKVEPHWFAGGAKFWYRVDLPERAREFVLVDAGHGTRRVAFDHARLAGSLGNALAQKCDPDRLPFDAIVFDDDANVIHFSAAGGHFRCDLRKYSVVKEEHPPERPEPKDRNTRRRPATRFAGRSTRSPDEKWETFEREHNLCLRHKESGEEFPLTDDGCEDDRYEASVFWSADSRRLIALRRTKAEDHKIYLVESSPKDQLQPKLHSHHYLKPGDRISSAKPHLFDVAGHKRITLSDELFPTPYEIKEFRWCPEGRRLAFLYNERGHRAMRIVEIDTEDGATRAIVDDQCKTFFDYAHKRFACYLDKSREIVWMSERDGWNHLYLYDMDTGKVKNRITGGKWVVRGVDWVDEEKRQVWFRAGGIHPGQDPYYVHYCRVDFDGSDLVTLTGGDGSHAIEYSPDERFLIDTYSRIDMAPVTELRRTADGKLVCALERGDVGALVAAGWRAGERFVAKGRDRRTDIYGVIWRPTTFDPMKKYPVIEKIYAGPQTASVPKRFRACSDAQQMAELGFIVVEIDGMGTSHRSKAFHDVCWKNIGDFGLADRILWMKAAAKRYPYMDLGRVGIYGGSAGGQASTRAILEHPDFYKVCVSASGCHDNRMDKIWWNELWMSWPVGPHYAENSNVTHAHKLQGKLLLIAGELDRNVEPASTLQLVNALIKADKDFEMLLIPGTGHGDGGKYGERRRRDFFVRHLLGVEPRAQ